MLKDDPILVLIVGLGLLAMGLAVVLSFVWYGWQCFKRKFLVVHEFKENGYLVREKILWRHK